MTEPSTEELIKAVYELSILVGIMPSRIEREEISAVANALIAPWLVNHIKPEELGDWLRKPGVVKAASKRGYEKHMNQKQHKTKP